MSAGRHGHADDRGHRARGTVDEILSLLQSSADANYIGEEISQLEHALQCAQLARQAHAADPEIIAALLHDIGHLCAPVDSPQMGAVGVAEHERIGADFLRARGFSDDVARLVQGHVAAKRYLAHARGAGYLARLSPASRTTLEHQGGPMSDGEALAFRNAPSFHAMLRLRQWDEGAKRVDWQVPDLESYRGLLGRHLERSPGAR